jgi:excisionase family DNA binding protein
MKKHRYAREKPLQKVDAYPSHSQVAAPRLLLSVAEAAALLGVSKRTVFLLLRSGDLLRKKVRRRTMIHRDEIARFAAEISAGRSESSDLP